MRVNLRSSISQIYSIAVVIFIFYRECRIFSLLGNINIIFLLIAIFIFGIYIISSLSSGSSRRIMKDDKMLIPFAFYVVVDGIVRTQYRSEAFEYWAFLLSAIAFKIILQNDRKAVSVFINELSRAAVISTGLIFLQGIFPTVVSGIQKIWFSNSNFENLQSVYTRGYCTGLTSHADAAVWYCFVLLAIIVGKLFTSRKNNLIWISVLILALISMFFTQKRSILISSVVAIYVMFVLFGKKKNFTTFRVFLLSFFLVIVFLLAYAYIPQVKYMWYRTNEVGRVLSGREYFWEILMVLFKTSPIIGVGGGTCEYLFGYGGHNCYIQLLAEYGVVGLILFVFGFGLPLCRCIYNAKRYLEQNRWSKQTSWLITSIMIQVVFFIYCITGNPLFDNIFFMTEISSIAIAQSILQGNFD